MNIEMKKLLTGLCLSTLFLIGISSAWNITVENKQSLSSCNANESHDVNYYLWKDGYSTRPIDTFGNITDSLISRWPDSSVQIRRNGVISDCNDWERVSTIAVANDSNWALVFHNQDWCNFNIPTYTKTNNPKAIDAQIHYTVWYRLVYPGWSNSLTSKLFHRDDGVFDWTCYPNGNVVSDFNSCPTVTVKYGEQKYHVWECLNYRVFRCGDGLLNSPSWTKYDNGTFSETCDPKDPTKKNRWNGWCSDSCQPITVTENPECNSAYNWQTVSNLVQWDYLCTKGKVSDFKYDEATHTWTWKCSNTAGISVNCSAKKPYDWKLKIEKTLIWQHQQVEKIWDQVKWRIKVTAVNGDVKDFTLTDNLPAVLDYVSYGVVSNPWVTVNAPTVNWRNITWQVTWILKSGQTLEIELVSKANQMPTQEEKNVACVSPKDNPNDKQCDDDYIVWNKWKLKITKTLVGAHTQVQNTWDEVKWRIKVTAVSGDVKGFTLTDNLPSVLDYVSYRVVSNPSNLSVWNPTVDWRKITWQVTWTLKNWQTLEIELVSKANQMPTQQEKNVACVKWPDPVDPNNPYSPNDDCDDDYITPNPKPNVRLKKTFTDWTKHKNVRIWEEVAYRISFGNNGKANATITSIKDFLPKNVQYISSEIYIDGVNVTQRVINTNKTEDWVYIDIFTWLTLKPGEQWYIILTGKVLSTNQDSRTNFACIYVNDEKIECDDARHDLAELMCKAPDIQTKSFSKSWGSTVVTCKVDPESEKADLIELDCGIGAWGIFTWKNISSLTWTCVYPANSSSSTNTYTVQCKVNWKTADICKWTVSVSGDNPPSSCFIAWTKVTMADGSQKNIEDVKIWEKLLWADWIVNTVLWYDRPVLWERHLWSINGSEYFVSDEHPFKTTEWWKSFDPEMTKLEIDLDTTELKVWDILIKNNGLEVIKSIEYIEWEDDTQLYNFVLDGDHTYYANSYLVHNKWWNEPYCTKPEISWTDRVKEVKCSTDNGRAADIKIDCGYNNQIYTSTWKVESLTGKCDYTWAPNGTYKVLCYANDENLSRCQGEVKYSWGPSGWGGWGSSGWGGWSSCTLEDGNRNYDNPICNFANPECFNVNEWNVSIEKWEILPFYFNIYKDKQDAKNYNFIVYEPSKYPLGTVNSYNWIKNDTKKCTPWSIALNSLKCTYKVLDGKNNEVYTKTIACLDDWSNLNKLGMIAAWLAWQKREYNNLQSTTNNGYTFTTNIDTTKPIDWRLNWNNNINFWEYKFQISKVEYLQCDPNGKWQSDDVESVCQSNFILTDPYTVQKTPSGNFTNTSTYKLRNYLYANGSSTMDWLLKSIADTSAYAPNDKVKTAMNNFIKKYEKLAVKVRSDKFWNEVTVKKVPWKDIYFLDGNVTFSSNTNTINKPFTIVQTRWNVTIKWNVQHNMMLLTNGNITFNWSCETTQTVKWIFYAWWSLTRSWVRKNNDLNNTFWCDEWWLQVKWVLVWNGLDGLMRNSRSSLTKWFGTDKKALAVMNWASVLIEYSPSVFTKSTMPPGAEDFTTALSVYKN